MAEALFSRPMRVDSPAARSKAATLATILLVRYDFGGQSFVYCQVEINVVHLHRAT